MTFIRKSWRLLPRADIAMNPFLTSIVFHWCAYQAHAPAAQGASGRPWAGLELAHFDWLLVLRVPAVLSAEKSTTNKRRAAYLYNRLGLAKKPKNIRQPGLRNWAWTLQNNKMYIYFGGCLNYLGPAYFHIKKYESGGALKVELGSGMQSGGAQLRMKQPPISRLPLPSLSLFRTLSRPFFLLRGWQTASSSPGRTDAGQCTNWITPLQKWHCSKPGIYIYITLKHIYRARRWRNFPNIMNL